MRAAGLMVVSAARIELPPRGRDQIFYRPKCLPFGSGASESSQVETYECGPAWVLGSYKR